MAGLRTDVEYMALTLAEARAAAARGEVPVGALLVDAETGAIIARDGNRTIETRDPTGHAEILVLREAGRLMDNHRLNGLDLYVSLEPCAMCAGAISFARLRRVVFGATDPKGGAVISGGRFFDQPTCHHRPEIVSGLLADDCGAVLKDFFAARR